MQPNLLLFSKILPQMIIKVGKLHVQKTHKFTSDCSPQRCKVIPEFWENVAALRGNVSRLLQFTLEPEQDWTRIYRHPSSHTELDRRAELDRLGSE